MIILGRLTFLTPPDNLGLFYWRMVCWWSFLDRLLNILSVWGLVLLTHKDILSDPGFVLTCWRWSIWVPWQCVGLLLAFRVWDVWQFRVVEQLCCLSNANRMVTCQQVGRMWIWVAVWFWEELLKAWIADMLSRALIVNGCSTCRWH